MKKPYYTPKEYEATFNEPWDERDAGYFADYTDTNDGGTDHRFWRVGSLGEVKDYTDDVNTGEVLCATTHCPSDTYVHETNEVCYGT
jgi:hypothetical protein